MSESLRSEYLISYDVEDNKIRRKIRKEVLKYGMTPVQKSVVWGYLTFAELQSIKRHLEEHIQGEDKAFITRTNFNGRGQSFFIGHNKEEFLDWKEYDVL